MHIKDEIFRYLDDGSTILVFPTENAARYYLSQYVREKRTSVLATRAMALDTFAQMFSPKHENKPSNKYHRLAFTASFLDCGNTGMTYLYKDSLFDNRQRFVSFLASILPQLGDLKEGDFKKGELFRLYKDLDNLKRNYELYLEKNGLFEAGWERHSLEFCPSFSGDYVLVGLDADVQMQRLMKELVNVPNIRTLTLDGAKKCTYEQYKTEEAELSVLFDRLLKLKKDKVSMEQIAISTPKLEELAPRLERKALECDVPLSFVKSVKLSDTVPGRYLFAIRRCINENMSFASMESLLLNDALPFTDMEANRILVRYMIDNNHQGGSLGYKGDSLYSGLSFEANRKPEEKEKDHENPNKRKPEEYARALELYKDLKNCLVEIRGASTGDVLIKAIHGLTCRLLGNSEFDQGNDEDRDVYSFIFSELGSINKTLKESNLEMKSIFSIFMGEVDKISYVDQKRTNGIRVYNYGQDYLIGAKHRFIVGLNDTNVEQKSVGMSFLEDFELQSRETYDVTDKILDYYMVSSENLHVSGSVSTYSGTVNAPTYFVIGNHVNADVKPTHDTKLHGADKASLAYASKTVLAPKGSDVAKTDCSFMPLDPEKRHFSYSSISNYVKCPYQAMLALELTVDSPDAFEPAQQDDKKIGTALHGAIQAFMKNHFNQFLDISHKDEYHAEIDQCLEEVLAHSVFDDYTKQSIRSKFRQGLYSVVDILLAETDKDVAGTLGGFTPISNEQKLDQNPHFKGYIDTVIRDAEGNTFLLDYKKGKAPATYQLVLYRQLYNDSHPGDEVDEDAVLFYSMKDCKFNGIEDYDDLKAKFDSDLEITKEGYRIGKWTATPDKNTCQGCSERRICRRRFNLQ